MATLVKFGTSSEVNTLKHYSVGTGPFEKIVCYPVVLLRDSVAPEKLSKIGKFHFNRLFPK